ncbi:hypothetical protein ACHAWU_001296 [Discostella pseudostelligera]|uniref:SAP domain-containing protein n=1 Tax=Discostella pseudostelligera TaxID=259834 RepID=A0ABD3MCF9_9STRA
MSDKSPSLIELPDISPKTFMALLLYIYGYKLPDLGNDISQIRRVLEAADKYGVTNLKLEAEVCYASSLSLTLENVLEHLSFAEAKNCAYLKEKAVDFIIRNTTEIIKRKTITTTSEGPSMSDILAAVARSQDEKKAEKELCAMSINELRHRAHEKGLDVDGSREMLVSTLESST